MPRPFRVERRALAPRPARAFPAPDPHNPTPAAEIAACGRPTAADVARVLRGRTDFPRFMFSEVM